ncbi:MAG TPA: hypothetical protein VGX23_05910 [Actinocrinis sp.]|nr:hypothetical protein [Actinocrinis sp.]
MSRSPNASRRGCGAVGPGPDASRHSVHGRCGRGAANRCPPIGVAACGTPWKTAPYACRRPRTGPEVGPTTGLSALDAATVAADMAAAQAA